MFEQWCKDHFEPLFASDDVYIRAHNARVFMLWRWPVEGHPNHRRAMTLMLANNFTGCFERASVRQREQVGRACAQIVRKALDSNLGFDNLVMPRSIFVDSALWEESPAMPVDVWLTGPALLGALSARLAIS